MDLNYRSSHCWDSWRMGRCNGESLPIHKTIDPLVKSELPIGDRKNMAFMVTVGLGLKEWGVIAVVAFSVGIGGYVINRIFRKRQA